MNLSIMWVMLPIFIATEIFTETVCNPQFYCINNEGSWVMPPQFIATEILTELVSNTLFYYIN